MPDTPRDQTPAFTFALIAIALALGGCGKLKEGIKAFYEGDFARSERLLRNTAEKAASMNPKFQLTKDELTPIESLLPHVTRDAFAAWQAYAGSLLGLNRPKESCKNIALALRPIRVFINKERQPMLINPRQGEFWQAEVMSLRAWWINIPCE